MEQTVKTIARNSIWMGLAQMSDKVLTILIFIICAKKLGPILFGDFAVAFSVFTILSVFYNLGLSLLFVREGARDKKNTINLLVNMIMLQVVLICIVSFFAFLFIPLFSYSKTIQIMIFVLLVGGGVFAISTTLQSFFQAIEKMFFVTLIRFCTKITWLLFLCIFIYIFHQGVVSVTVAYMFGAATGCLFGVLFIRQTIAKENGMVKVGLSFKYILSIFKASLSLALMGVIISCYSRADVLIISFLRGDYQVGIYSGAYKIYEASVLLSGAFLSAIFPKFVQHGISDKSIKIFINALKLMVICAFICIAFVYPFANYVILLIYGKAYLTSVYVLRILILAVIFSFSSHLTLYYLISCQLQKMVNMTITIIMLINVFLNFLLVSLYGIQGAAITMVISEALLAVAFLFILDKKEIISCKVYKGIMAKALFGLIFVWINYFCIKYMINQALFDGLEIITVNIGVSIFLLLTMFPELKNILMRQFKLG